MQIDRLEEKNPAHDAETWSDYRALYRGGKAFRNRVGRFLIQNPKEDTTRYDKRKAEAVYRNYVGFVVDYFGSHLFRNDMNFTATDASGADVDGGDFYDNLQADATGSGKPFAELLRDGFTEAAVTSSAWWAVRFPEVGGAPIDRADYLNGAWSAVALKAFERESVTDWARDDAGNLLWVCFREESSPRADIGDSRETIVVSWTVYDRQAVTRYSLSRKRGEAFKQGQDVPMVWRHVHNLGAVPVVEMAFPPALWVLDRLESPQKEHFRLSAANNWSMRQSCYAMPVFRVKEELDQTAFGSGTFIQIGIDEHADWLAPPTAHLDTVAKEIKAQKDELFRIVGQMALGVDNNAGTVGRSAESKMADAESVRILLQHFGTKIRQAATDLLNMVSLVRGDELTWTVDGLERFATLDAESLIVLLKEALDIDIPSRTFQIEAKTRAATALLPGLDEDTRQAIRKEIETGQLESEAKDKADAERAARESDAFHAALQSNRAALNHDPDPATQQTNGPSNNPGAGAGAG